MLSVMSGEYQSVVSNEWRVSVLSVMSGEYQSVVSHGLPTMKNKQKRNIKTCKTEKKYLPLYFEEILRVVL